MLWNGNSTAYGIVQLSDSRSRATYCSEFSLLARPAGCVQGYAATAQLVAVRLFHIF